MSKEVLINCGAGEIRVAIVEDGKLQELFLERTIGLDDGALKKKGGRGGHSLIGNIILGRVQRVLPGMQAAFVDVGLDRSGFLGAREASVRILHQTAEHHMFEGSWSESLQTGQRLRIFFQDRSRDVQP